MKRSATVPILLVTAVAAAMLSCQRKGRYCVDQNNFVVKDDECKEQSDPHYYPQHWYYIGGRGYIAPGTQLSGGSTSAPLGGFRSPNEGTTRGVIGGAAEEASGHGGGGHGEGGGGE